LTGFGASLVVSGFSSGFGWRRSGCGASAACRAADAEGEFTDPTSMSISCDHDVHKLTLHHPAKFASTANSGKHWIYQ
jgi:hypothetical protein